MLLIVDLNSPWSIPSLTEMFETSEQLEMADSLRCTSVESLREVLREADILSQFYIFHFFTRQNSVCGGRAFSTERGKGPFNFLSPPLLLDWCFQLFSLSVQCIEEEGAPPLFSSAALRLGLDWMCRERDFVASFGPSLG